MTYYLVWWLEDISTSPEDQLMAICLTQEDADRELKKIIASSPEEEHYITIEKTVKDEGGALV